MHRRISQSTPAYYINDDFTTNRAAGSVNATAAEPGPGARNVVDTSNNLSLSSGLLSRAGGSLSDPILRYAAPRARLAGLALAYLFQQSGTVVVGVNNTVSTSATESGYTSSTNLRHVSPGGIDCLCRGSLTFPARAVLVLRANGSFLFHGNLLVGWTKSGNAAVNVHVYANSVTGAILDYVRMPSALWLPTPLISDGFGTSFGTTDGQGHPETSGLGAGGSGLSWVHNTYSVSGGKAINTPNVGSELLTNTTFDTDASSWTAVNATLTSVAGGQSNNALEVKSTVASAATAYGYQQVTTAAGDWVLAVVYHKNGTQSGSMRLASTSGGTDIKQLTVQSDGSWTRKALSGRAVNTTTFLRLSVGAGTTNDTTLFDEASVKKITMADLFASVSTATADVIADAEFTVPNGLDAGLVINLDSTSSPANFVLAYLDRFAATVYLVKYVAGVPTVVNSGAITYASGANIRVAKIGTAYRVYYNNAVVTTGTITDVGIISNTKHGLFVTDSSITVDNYTVYASGSGSEYTNVDSY